MDASDWIKGIGLSILASMIGGASKLAIRKSWLIQAAATAAAVQQAEPGGDGIFRSESQPAENPVEQITTPPPPMPVMMRIMTPSGSEADLVSLRRRASNPPGMTYTAGYVSVGSNNSSDNSSSTSSHHHHSGNNNNNISLSAFDVSHQASSAGYYCEEEEERQRHGSLCIAYFLRGCGLVGMTFLNPLCCVVAMNYASPSILAPFSGLTLVWIVLLSSSVVGEAPTSPQLVAATLIVLGQVLVAAYGDHTNDIGVTVEQVRQSYLHPPFLLYFAGLALWMLLLLHWIRRNALSSPVLQRFSWGVSGGSITGMQNFLKDSLTILKAVKAAQEADHDDGNRSAYPWFFYLFILLAILSAFGGLLCLTATMKRYDATYSSAMFVASFVVSASIMSAVHYDTFQHLTSWSSKVLYPLGLLVLMSGVHVLVRDATAGGRGGNAEDNESHDHNDLLVILPCDSTITAALSSCEAGARAVSSMELDAHSSTVEGDETVAAANIKVVDHLGIT